MKDKILILVASFVLVVTPIYSESFSDKRIGLKLSIPSQFKVIASPQDNVSVLMAKNGTSFPSFNVIIQAGNYNLNKELKAQANNLLDSYIQVGITEAKVSNAQVSSLANLPAFTATINYKLVEKTMTSWVAIVDRQTYHLIFTYSDESNNYLSNLATRDALVRSVKL